jgi:hypothetical protein
MTPPASFPVMHWLRMVALVIGAGLFLWLPFEDTGINTVLFFAILICSWWAVRFLVFAPAPAGTRLRRHVVVATLAGLFVSPVAIFLMVVKTGLHAHASPDFTPEQLQAALLSTPVWILAGFFLGLGSGLWREHRGTENAPSS